MWQFKPKTIGKVVGAVGGLGIATGVLQGFGIDARAVAQDVAVVVTEGALGCAVPLSNVCAAGGRLVAVAALLGIAVLGAFIGHCMAPAAGAPAGPVVPGPVAEPVAEPGRGTV